MITVLLSAMLSGCDVSVRELLDAIESTSDDIDRPEDDITPVSSPGAIQVIDINGDVHETSIDVIDAAESEDDPSAVLPASSLEAAASDMDFSAESNYAYSQLPESTRTCYGQIYAILTGMLEKVELTTLDTEEVDLAFRAVMLDHPEIFYVKGYSIGKYMNGSILKKIVFSGTYTMSKPEAEAKRVRVDEYVQNVIDGIPDGSGEFDRIKYVYDYLIRNNEYVLEADNNQNILSVVESGRTVCQGYTKMMQLILGRMGMFCTLVNGKACGRNGVPDQDDLKDSRNAEWGGHVWNIIRCNGRYYNMDVTWGDAAITLMNTDGTLSSDIDVNYEFFLVDDVSLMGTHEAEPVVAMPACYSMEDNYYNHEGVYFTSVDTSQLYRAFESALSSGGSHVFIKASSPQVYEALREHLFDDQNVFEYMGRTNVRYVEFEERNLIMISL